MQNDDPQSHQKFLKKLRKKAELCRYCHSELKRKYTTCRNWKEFAIIFLSVFLAVLIGFYYRGVFTGEWILASIFILPFVITITQSLDSTVCHWTYKMTRHETAVAIWGNWIREAHFLEKHICQYPNDIANEKIKNIQEKYNDSMSSTEQIPNNKFLKYKQSFRAYKLKSKKIDTMSLEDIEGQEREE